MLPLDTFADMLVARLVSALHHMHIGADIQGISPSLTASNCVPPEQAISEARVINKPFAPSKPKP